SDAIRRERERGQPRERTTPSPSLWLTGGIVSISLPPRLSQPKPDCRPFFPSDNLPDLLAPEEWFRVNQPEPRAPFSNHPAALALCGRVLPPPVQCRRTLSGSLLSLSLSHPPHTTGTSEHAHCSNWNSTSGTD